ncbi:MFS transporter [Enterococcus cecorum]|uniref:MFS transporter n=1 Tax=Enterococcus cecorum TaxID=44008 RepID=UPI003265A05E
MSLSKIEKTIPMFMLVFISSATMVTVFNIISPQLVVDFHISPTTVSLLSMVAMLTMGVASVVYSTLSDYISIKKLMIFGITLLNLGTILAYLATFTNFYFLLFAVALMIFGGTCGSGLMIIAVIKYIDEKQHAKYYGYNTACVSISQALGILLGGFITTYLGWRNVFIIPVTSLIAVWSIIKYLPNDEIQSDKKLDILGLSLLTGFTLFISLALNFSKTSFFVIAFFLLACFFFYIRTSKTAFISIHFFKNKPFVILNLLVALCFGIQSAMAFLYPFLLQTIYQIGLDKVSLVILPSYFCGALMGFQGGKLVEKYGSYKVLTISLSLSTLAFIITAIFIQSNIFTICILACVIAASFALLYPPFMKLVNQTLDISQIGVGIGFFNLMTSIGPSILIVLTGKMMMSPLLQKSLFLTQKSYTFYQHILLIYAALLILAVIIINLFSKNVKGGK